MTLPADRYRSGVPLSRKGFFQLVAEEAFKDGRIEPVEQTLLQKLSGFLGIPPDSARRIAQQAMEKYRSGTLGTPRRLDPLCLYERVLYFVWSDGQEDPKEHAMLDVLAKIFRISDEHRSRLLEKVRDPRYSEVSGVEEAPPTEEVELDELIAASLHDWSPPPGLRPAVESAPPSPPEVPPVSPSEVAPEPAPEVPRPSPASRPPAAPPPRASVPSGTPGASGTSPPARQVPAPKQPEPSSQSRSSESRGAWGSLLRPIESDQDAEELVSEATTVFFVVAGFNILASAILGMGTLVEGLGLAAGAGLVRTTRNRGVACLLLGYSSLIAVLTVAHRFGGESAGGGNVWLAALALASGVRLVEAVFFLQGQGRAQAAVAGLPVALLVALLGYGMVGSQSGPSWERVLGETVRGIQAASPKVLDEYTRLDGAQGGPGRQLTYLYTLNKVEKPISETLENRMRQALQEGARKDMGVFASLQIRLVYLYRNEAGEELLRFEFEPSEFAAPERF